MKIVFLDADAQAEQFMQGKGIEGSEVIVLKDSIKDAVRMDTVKDAEILSIFVHTTKIDAETLSKFKKLKMIATRSTGFDHIDLEYCKAHGIAVSNVPAYGAVTVAEYTFALLLDVVRNVRLSASDMRKGKVSIPKYMGVDLCGRTLGVIGTGSIGQHVIKIAKGFGMDVIAHDPYPKEIEGVRYMELGDLYRQADIITLHIPSTPENYHMIDAGALEAMKDGSFIINTARGDLIDPEALYFALKNGRLKGAGLDVLEYEDFLFHDDVILNPKDQEYAFKSMINSKIMLLDNVVLTPHIAFNSVDAVNRILQTTFDNIAAFTKGETKNKVA